MRPVKHFMHSEDQLRQPLDLEALHYQPQHIPLAPLQKVLQLLTVEIQAQYLQHLLQELLLPTQHIHLVNGGMALHHMRQVLLHQLEMLL